MRSVTTLNVTVNKHSRMRAIVASDNQLVGRQADDFSQAVVQAVWQEVNLSVRHKYLHDILHGDVL